MQLIITHEPIAKARHRHFKRGPKVITFDPQCADQKKMKRLLLAQMQENGFEKIIDGPISMELTTYSSIPPSWSKKRQSLSGDQPKASRPDIDNYVKFYSDVLNEIAYDDDRQITRLWSEKLYSKIPRVEILIQPIGREIIHERAITVRGELTIDEISRMIKRANQLGMQKRAVLKIYIKEDSEGKHLYFETEDEA